VSVPTLNLSDWPVIIVDHLRSSDQPLIVIVGPTAGGKTAFSLDIAEHIAHTSAQHGWDHAEIINADSRQLYRFMNIGTAKITEKEKRGVVHHLLDVLHPDEEATIAWYKEEATKVIADCHRRKVVPLLVGGSMLYISAVVDGLDPLPKADPALRKRIEEEYDKDDGWTLFEKLEKIDPATAHAFDKQNKVYVVRAMELYEMTGIAPSKLKKTIPPPYQTLMLGLRWPRETIVKRIDERVRQMLRSGWIEEVEGLMDRGYGPQHPGMKSHGYKEIMMWLSSEERHIDELADVIARKTRAYAKRQMTWWDQEERVLWMGAMQMIGS